MRLFSIYSCASNLTADSQLVDRCLKVKILYVRNLMLSTTEHSLERLFTDVVADKVSDGKSSEGAVVERVKKIRDYAFVHFRDRELALAAMDRLNGYTFTIRFGCACLTVVSNEFRK